MRVDPDKTDAGILVVRDGLGNGERHRNHQCADHAPLFRIERRGRRFGAIGFGRFFAERAIARDIGRKARQHEYASKSEARMPAIDLRQQSANQRPQCCADIDAHGEDRIAARASRAVVFGIELADLRGDVALEQSATDDKQEQREQEGLIERHRDVAAAHQHRADHHRIAAAQPAIGDQAAEHRREIDEARIETVDLRGERQRR